MPTTEDRFSPIEAHFLNKIFISLLGSIINFEKSPVLHAVEQVYGIVNSKETDEFTEKVRHSVGIIDEALSKYR